MWIFLPYMYRYSKTSKTLPTTYQNKTKVPGENDQVPGLIKRRGKNNLNLGKTNSIEKQLNDVKIKKGNDIIGLKTTYKVILLKKT